jgi:hypothetical protein
MIDDMFDKVGGTFAKSTIRASRSDFIQYQARYYHNNMDSKPAPADAMPEYVDSLATVKKSATVRSRINSLGEVLKLSEHYDPTNQLDVILAIKRTHRKVGRPHQQDIPLTKPLLNQQLSNCYNSVRDLGIQVLLRLGYETMRSRSELCTFKFKDINQAQY